MPQLFKMVNGENVPLNEEEILKFEAMEQEHLILQQQLLLVEYKEKRRKEYPPLDDIIVALVEKEEGRTEALNALMLQRLQVKNKYPKPQAG